MTELQKEVAQEVMELNGISETEAIDRVLNVEKAIYVFPIIGIG